MLVYDRAYMELKNKYLLPLTAYTVDYSRLRQVNVKSMLLANITSVDIKSSGEYVFGFDDDCLLKALLGDIEIFYIRKIIQGRDAEFCRGEGISANWNIVTNYYNAFFTASLMLRFCYRGNIFLDKSLKGDLEKIIATITGELVQLASNQFYEVYNQDGHYVLKLSGVQNGTGTHELVWKKMDILIDEMLMLSRKDTDEYVVLSSIKQINNKLTSTFPSQLRNRVNYQPQYILEYMDKTLFQLDGSFSWIDYLLKCKDTDNDNRIACYMYAYAKYIEHFCLNFVAEYYIIKGKGNGIISKINSHLSEKIKMEKAQYIF